MAFEYYVVEFLRSWGVYDTTPGEFLMRIIVAILLIAAGIVVGILARKGLNRLLENSRIKQRTSSGFFDLLIRVIEISVYVIFINIALFQLRIPSLTIWITSVLLIIPGFFGALILIGLGFAVAVYLKSIVEDSQVVGWKALSLILFYFVIYVSLVYALKSALISVDAQVSNLAIMILSVIFGIGVIYYHFRKESKEIKIKK